MIKQMQRPSIPKIYALIPILTCAVFIGITVGGFVVNQQKNSYPSIPTPISQTLGAKVESKKLIINEVFTTPDAFQSINNINTSQWIEIYNPNEIEVELSNWSIHESMNCDEFLGESVIPANGVAVISPATQAEFRSIWGKSQITFIPMSSAIGNGMEEGEKLSLSSSSCESTQQIVDELTIPIMKEGESYQRPIEAVGMPNPGQ